MSEQSDLTTCDKELIHIPAAIQPHGVMLVLAEPELRIAQASASLLAHLGLNAGSMLNQNLALLLDGPSLERVESGLAQDLTDPHYLPPLMTSTGRQFEALIHRTPAGLILELEPYAGSIALDTVRILRDTMDEVHRAPTLDAVCRVAAERLRGLTGFDRVMVYRFRSDDAGTVVAEARREDLPPYLGLTYPALDIPAPARKLLLVNPLRVRTGAEEAPSPLVPALSPATGAPLDMTRCALRATAPVHLEYLRNMGVRASLTLSIVREGRLWGMFACHHDGQKYVPHAHRLLCEALGHLLTLQIDAKEKADDAARRLRMQDWALRSLHVARGSADLPEALIRLGPSLPGATDSQGAVVHAAGRSTTFGTTPTNAQLAELVDWLRRRPAGGLFSSAALSREFPAAAAYTGSASGLLALPLTADGSDWVMWMRGELSRTVQWAGDPRKPAGDLGDERISPRRSFAAWAEAVRGQAEPWTPAELDAVCMLHQALLDVIALDLQR